MPNNNEDQHEALSVMRDAMQLTLELEEVMDGKDLMVILMALTKVCGVMLAEARGLSPAFSDEEKSLTWMATGMSMAYRLHLKMTTPTDGHVH